MSNAFFDFDLQRVLAKCTLVTSLLKLQRVLAKLLNVLQRVLAKTART